MGYLFTSESVSEGHPDKVADQISDAVLDKLLAYDPSSKVACETLVTTGQVVLAGEVKTKAYVDLQLIAREVIQKIGYTKGEYMFESNSCGVLSAIHEQSPDINRGVERQDPMEQGAGDQGRPAQDPVRGFPAPVEHRRAAPVHQRAQGRHVHRGAAAAHAPAHRAILETHQ